MSKTSLCPRDTVTSDFAAAASIWPRRDLGGRSRLDLSGGIEQRELLQVLVFDLQPTVTRPLPQFLDQASPLVQVSRNRERLARADPPPP